MGIWDGKVGHWHRSYRSDTTGLGLAFAHSNYYGWGPGDLRVDYCLHYPRKDQRRWILSVLCIRTLECWAHSRLKFTRRWSRDWCRWEYGCACFCTTAQALYRQYPDPHFR